MSSTSVPALPGLAPLTTFIGGKDTPILEKGNLTPSIFDDFKTAASSFFRKAKISLNYRQSRESYCPPELLPRPSHRQLH
jgi:hypothetical protein